MPTEFDLSSNIGMIATRSDLRISKFSAQPSLFIHLLFWLGNHLVWNQLTIKHSLQLDAISKWASRKCCANQIRKYHISCAVDWIYFHSSLQHHKQIFGIFVFTIFMCVYIFFRNMCALRRALPDEKHQANRISYIIPATRRHTYTQLPAHQAMSIVSYVYKSGIHTTRTTHSTGIGVNASASLTIAHT